MATLQYDWCLTSSSGRERLCGLFIRGGVSEEGVDLLLADVSIAGEFWPQPPFDDGQLTKPLEPAFSVSLPKVIFERSQLMVLLRELDQWLSLPRPLAIELSRPEATYQSFRIALGVRPDIISSLERPACTIVYGSNSFEHGAWHFVVDQSCLRIFHEQLSRSLDVFKQ